MVTWIATLGQNLRFSLRTLRRNLGFTAVAVITLALGIGANAAIFSVVNAVLLRPLSYSEPERLVMVWSTFASLGGETGGTAPPDFREWLKSNRAFSDMAAFNYRDLKLPGAGHDPRRIQGAAVSPNLFRLRGVSPFAGRDFLSGED